MTNKPYVGDVLTPQDILDHERTLLVAGVGSGKNTFFEEQFPDKKVLIVTSRTAKVNQSISDLARRGIHNVAYWTYSKLAKEWLAYCKTKTPHKHWYVDHSEHSVFDVAYDLIVFDEVHALVVDATFADDRTICYDFLQWGTRIDGYKNPILVFSTATPQPLLSYCRDNGFREVNLFNTCRNILPRRIVVRRQADILREIGINPFSYFTTMKTEFPNLLAYMYQLHNGKEKMDIYYAGKKAEDTLPDNVFATSVFREAINIHNENPATVVVESHDPLTAYQFAGRFRGGIDTLYIVWNAKQVSNTLSYDAESWYRFQLKQNPIWCGKPEEIAALTNGFIVQSPYASNLYFNEWKLEGIRHEENVLRDFKNRPQTTLADYFGDGVTYDVPSIEELGNPTNHQDLYKTSGSNMQDFKKYLDEFMGRHGVGSVGVTLRPRGGKEYEYIISKSEKDELMRIARDKFGVVNPKTGMEYKQAKRFFESFGYSIDKGSKDKSKSSNYDYFGLTSTNARRLD